MVKKDGETNLIGRSEKSKMATYYRKLRGKHIPMPVSNLTTKLPLALRLHTVLVSHILDCCTPRTQVWSR